MDNLIFDIGCENCNKKFKLDTSKGKKGNSVKCPHCGAIYQFKDDNLKKMNDAFKNFWDNINKKFKR